MSISFFSRLGESLGQTIQNLLFVSLVAGLIVLMAALLHRLLRKWLSPGGLYLLWMLVIVRFVLFAVPESPTSFLNLIAQQDISQQPYVDSSTIAGLPEGFWADAGHIRRQETVSGNSGAIAPVSKPAIDLWWIAGFVWIAGVVVLALRLLIGYSCVRQLVASTNKPTALLQRKFDRLRNRIGVRQHVALRVTDKLTLPAMVGVFRPKVLLPSWCVDELDDRQLELILAHELIHIYRFDGLVQLLAHLVAIVHWFNPMVRVTCRFIESCRELSCDRRVIETMKIGKYCRTEKIYGQTILDIAERSSGNRQINSAFLGGFINNNQNLMRERIAMLVGTKSSRRWSKILGGVCMLLLLSVGYTAAQTVCPPAASSPPQSTFVQPPGYTNSGLRVNPLLQASRQDDELDLNTEIQITQDESINLMGGGRELMDRFEVSDKRVCELRWANNQVRVMALQPGQATAQFTDKENEVHLYKVIVVPRRPIRIVRGNTRRLIFEDKIPELMVANPDVIHATPVSPKEILVTGVACGVSALTVTLSDRRQVDREIHVVPDTRGMEETIKNVFPGSSVAVNATDSAIILSGYALKGQPNEIRDFVDKLTDANVVSQVGETELFAIKMEIFEVDKERLVDARVEFRALADREFTSVADLLTDARIANSEQTIAIDKLDSDDPVLQGLRQAFQQKGVARLLDQPTLVAANNRPAEFLKGGEVPIPTIDENGKSAVEFRPFGTLIHIRPILMDEDQLTLELRAEFSELDEDLSNVKGVPGFRVRRLNTGLQMKLGQTTAVVGDYQTTKSDADTETVILITPRLIKQ